MPELLRQNLPFPPLDRAARYIPSPAIMQGRHSLPPAAGIVTVSPAA